MKLRILLLLLVLVLSPPVSAEESPTAREREAVHHLDLAFGEAVSSRQPERFNSLIAADGIFLADKVARGRAAFKAAWAPLYNPRKKVEVDWVPVETGVAASGELAYTIGRVAIRYPEPGTRKAVENAGHYLSIWKKNDQGAWKIAVNGHLVAHPEGSHGIGRERQRGLSVNWPALAEPDADVGLEMKNELFVAAESGDMAYTFGEYTIELGAGEAAEKRTGGFLRLWTRDVENAWIVAAESFSAPMAP